MEGRNKGKSQGNGSANGKYWLIFAVNAKIAIKENRKIGEIKL